MQNTIRKKRPKNQQVWGFIGLSLVFSSVFLLYPIVYSLYLSLHRMQGLQSVFVGFGNYLRMLQDTIFQKALLNNFIFLIFQVPIMVLLGLLLAFVLNTPKLVGRSFFKLALFLPCVTSLVSYAVLFKMMFQIGGIVNQGLLNIGLITQPLDWLNNPLLAKLTVI
ncbi:MAG: sugar ABC transporter permease, partial [Enterococcus casseliflavus]